MTVIFKGAATALVTPMNRNGIDYEAFGRLIDWQIEEGINGLVIAGTTGEASTMSEEEYKEVLRFAIERAGGRVAMIAGTGSNHTAHAIERTRYACSLGYDACLVVTPYYNKATQNGLVAMYTAIADASAKPLILYNVPSRTGVSIKAETYAKLAGHPMIAAIKEASGDFSEIVSTMALVNDDLALYSGNDDMIVPTLACGGMGVISVLSNLLPAKTVEMCRLYFEGHGKESMDLQKELLPLIHALFSETNPIPVKAAMAAMGYGENVVRLPLTPMEESHWEILRQLMEKEGLL